MASNVADCFDLSGPAHILSRAIYWNDEEDRRCIAACLVKGTYLVENDRARCRMDTLGHAAPWYKSFHFELDEVLTVKSFGTKSASFIFGAIYKNMHVSPSPAGAPLHESAPQYVVAFRGTMLHHTETITDLYGDLRIIANTLSKSKRSECARAAVNSLLDKAKARSEKCVVWLAGHSLGASLALQVGRDMMDKQGLNLPTFLFNPPHVSLGPATYKLPGVVKTTLYNFTYLLKAAVAELAFDSDLKHIDDLFERLSPWVPNLYVHEKDIISQGFISHFQQRQHFLDSFYGLGKSAMALSYRVMLFNGLFGEQKERPHLLPCATLWKNSSMDRDVHGVKKLLAAHELQQWWKRDEELELSIKRYSFA